MFVRIVQRRQFVQVKKHFGTQIQSLIRSSGIEMVTNQWSIISTKKIKYVDRCIDSYQKHLNKVPTQFVILTWDYVPKPNVKSWHRNIWSNKIRDLSLSQRLRWNLIRMKTCNQQFVSKIRLDSIYTITTEIFIIVTL